MARSRAVSAVVVQTIRGLPLAARACEEILERLVDTA